MFLKRREKINITGKKRKYAVLFFVICLLISHGMLVVIVAQDGRRDTSDIKGLRYPIEEKNNYPFSTSGFVSPMLLRPPSNIEQKVVYNPASGTYMFSEKIGDLNYKTPSSMSLGQYRQYEADKSKSQYWKERSLEESGTGPAFMKTLRIGNQALDRVFGTDEISIVPQGSAELIFGYSISKTKNPAIPIRDQRSSNFVFDQKIMMNVTGSIGDKMQVGLSYNTEATFDFENKTKLEYTGKEDEIIKKIEAGDITFTLPGTLITGSQSLFGFKTELQFGRLTVTSVLSHQEGESSSINVEGGAQLNEFEISVDEYDANRHFFLSHFFRDNYNAWLQNLPYIESQVQIQQLEVWIVNKQSDFTESRNIVAFMDLAESYGPDGQINYAADPDLVRPERGENQPADNSRNGLYQTIINTNGIRNVNSIDGAVTSLRRGYNLTDGTDYYKVQSAKPLSDREYTVNRELGYISLNSPLRNDEILAVAFTYTYRGRTYVVGELTNSIDAPNTLIVKLLKGIVPTPKQPTWDLMMKNVYSIGAYQVNREGFIFDIFYRNDKTGVPVNYISERDPSTISESVNEQILLKVLDLDNLDSRNEPTPDGVFDFIEGVTFNSRNGRVYFPTLEPFGKDLREKITDGSETDIVKNRTADKYVFEELYDSTQTKAKQVAEKNKFLLKGRFQSSVSSEIQLNAMNVPKGSVKVSAGGITLVEGTDYTVDYTLGRVRIINQGLVESGTPIRITLESNSMFAIQTKNLLGTHLDYKVSENFNVGATIMRLTEKPLTQKVNMGEEPISNTIWGLNTSYRTQSQLLTTLVDRIPLIETKQPSSISVEAEFAHLIPGQSKVIGKNGVAYIDDFEAAQSKIELKTFSNWTLASPPRGQNDVFTYADNDSVRSGYGRARLAWYVIDPLFYGSGSLKPDNVDDEPDDLGLDNNYVRRIEEQEIFPEKDNQIPGQNYLSTLNVSYYPNERGPYNFDSNLSNDGKLNWPQTRWGGMMREIVNSDFETANIEFIEFWVMDPYLDSTDHAGGDLYFQLGEISEDILRDGRKSFENGLPVDPNDTKEIDVTTWGRVPKGQSLVNAFENDPNDRKNQDVGLDGLSNELETAHFNWFINSLPEPMRNIVSADPAADDFEYYLSDNHDNQDHNILQRYARYNGLDGNSPTPEASGSRYTSASKNTPDVEDINRDNTLNTTETYFQYHVSMRPEDLEVGRNYIVDKAEKVFSDDAKVVWYQFRIPIGEPELKIGQIEDFKSIRFLRMLLTGFDKPVYLRFATFDLVRGEWRRYIYDMNETAPSIGHQVDGSTFEVSAVNIEENESKEPVNYVLPPGIDRAIDPSNQLIQELNEQSLLLKVIDLADGDARCVFKNTEMDLRQYKNLKMFIHAEALPDGMTLEDYEVNGFIRIGSDYQNNYYEYEVPLKVTPKGHYNPDNNGQQAVWPVENVIELEMEKLINLKVERNELVKNDPLRYSTQTVYTRPDDDKNLIKVKGNPNLANIRQIIIGVRNPGDGSSHIANDGLSKSAEVWFNELRLTDFNNKGGWAANGRVQTQLADFGVVNVAGSTSKPGFGSIEEKVEERSKEETNQYDISGNLEMGKFFPEKAKVSIPLYVGLSRTIINPEYYPKDPDVKLADVLRNAGSKREKDSIRNISQDYTSRKSFNLTNVRWNKQFKILKFSSPGNFTANTGYSYTESHNYSTEYDNLRKYGAGLNYVYSPRTKSIQPFQKSKALSKPAFRLLRDFNFSPLPTRVSLGTDFDRNYQEIKMRDIYDDVVLKIDSTVSKDFSWDRRYDIKWDLTRSLKLDYTATNNALIDEPAGAYDWFEPDNQHWKDSVKQNISHGGRNMNFSQSFSASYNVPINKIPIFNWINLNTSYSSTFNWVRGEKLRDETRQLGNKLDNSGTYKINNSFNLQTLYSKVGYLKNLDSKSSKKGKEETRTKTVEFKKSTFFRKDVPKNVIHKLNTEVVEIKVYDAEGKEVQAKSTVVSENKVTVTTSEDIMGATVVVTGEVPLGQKPIILITDNTLRLITGFKNANFSWTKTRGTLLPGYLPETKYFGQSMTGEYPDAPGWPFAFGYQDWNIVYKAIDNDWLTKDTSFSKPIVFTENESFSFKITYEPFRGFRIDLTNDRRYNETNEQIYFYDSLNPTAYKNYFVDHKYKGGNFSTTIISIGTAFEKVSEKNRWESAAFNKMKENRSIISARRHSEMAERNPNYGIAVTQPFEDGFYDGYGPTSQEVLVPAFLAAYTNTNPNRVTLQSFFWSYVPNWRITFDGLSKISFIKDYFKSVTLNHSYKSTYSIGSFGTNVNYYDNFTGNIFWSTEEIRGMMRDNQNNFIPMYQYSGVSINEQISPLIGIDMTWNNSLITKFEYGRTRMIALSLNNNQVNETRNEDYTIGAGYRFKEVPFSLTVSGNKTQIKSDLNVRFDLTIRDNISIIRFLASNPDDEREQEPTVGTKKLVISATADYVISEKVNIQFYYDYTRTKPHTSRSYLNTETSFGFSLRLSL